MAGSDKRIEQNFSNFIGLDVISSDLTRPKNAAKQALNFEIEKNYTLVNKELIYSEDSPISEHTYKYEDSDIKSGNVYFYWLVELDIYGKYTIHGPIKVITNIEGGGLLR